MGKDTFEVKEGKIGVILSAPHCFEHKRPSLRGVLKQSEPKTNVLVQEVAQDTGAWSISIVCPCTDYDPNYSKIESNPYKQKIKEIFKQNKFKALIDIHGLSDDHNYDLGIFYNMRYKRSKELAYSLLKELGRSRLLKDLSFHIGYTVKNNQETLTEYVSEKLKFPAIQIEIARYIRQDSKLFEALKESLSKFVVNI